MIDEPFDVFAETYDWIHTFRGDIPFWIYQAKRNTGPVLELGCGTGRTTWEIADAGVPIVGIDISMPMLQKAEAKRERYPNASSVILKLADMCDFNLGITFNTIIMPGQSFQYAITHEEQLKTFQMACAHLKKGGSFVIFTMAPPVEEDISEGVEFLKKTLVSPNTGNNCRYYEKKKINHKQQTITTIGRLEEYDHNGKVIQESNYAPKTLRWSTARQLEKLGELTQLNVVACFSDWLRRPYRTGDPFLIYAYEK